MENYIFRYELADAWGDTITKVEIVDGWKTSSTIILKYLSL